MADKTWTSTADFNAGTKSNSGGNYEIETYTDNLAIADGSFQLGSMLGDNFNFADADALTWKWERANPTGNIIATNTASEITSGYLHLYANTPSGGTRGGTFMNIKRKLTGDFDIRARIKAVGISQNEYVDFRLWQDANNYVAVDFGYDTSEYLRAYTYINGTYTQTLHQNADVDRLVRITRDATNLTVFYKLDETADINSDADWVQLHQKAVGTATGELWINPYVYTSNTLPSTIDGYFYKMYAKTGTMTAGAYRTSGNWLSDAFTPADTLSNLRITHSGLTAANYIDKVEIIKASDSTVLSTYPGDIIAGTATSLIAEDFNNGFGTTKNTSIKTKVYLVGDGTTSPVITEIIANYEITEAAAANLNFSKVCKL